MSNLYDLSTRRLIKLPETKNSTASDSPYMPKKLDLPKLMLPGADRELYDLSKKCAIKFPLSVKK